MRNPDVHCRYHKSWPLKEFLTQKAALDTLTPYLTSVLTLFTNLCLLFIFYY
jgi:hypothetical protein